MTASLSLEIDFICGSRPDAVGCIFNYHFPREFIIVLFQCWFSKGLFLPGLAAIALIQASPMRAAVRRELTGSGEKDAKWEPRRKGKPRMQQ